MKKLLLLLWAFPVFAQTPVAVTTTWPATENPIATNGGSWKNGAADGVAWGNIASSTNLAHGTVTTPTCPGGVSGCNDSTAVLNATFQTNQIACSTVFLSGSLSRNSNFYESEIRLRTSIASNSITGYEFNYAMGNDGGGHQYAQIVKWNGAKDNFTLLNAATSTALTNGDTFCAKAVGTTLTTYLIHAGVVSQQVTWTDATYNGGAPGLGFFNQGGSSADNLLYGSSNFFAYSQASGDFRIAASCSTTDVAAAISAAASGDTVVIPPGTCAWTSGVTIPTGKAINVFGMGSGAIPAYSSTTLTISVASKTLTVVTSDPSTALSATTFPVSSPVTISELGNRQNFMVGTVTSFTPGSGSLTVNVTSTGGSCGNNSSGQSPSNCKRWLLMTPPTTVITNNATSGTQLFSITENTANHTNVGHFKVAQGTGTTDDFNIFTAATPNDTGKAVLLHDLWLEGVASPGATIHSISNKGVIWHSYFDSTPYSMAPVAFQLQGDSLTNSWSTTSTMGTADTTGENNVYFEDNLFAAYLNASDFDNNARGVWRYNVMDNAGFGTHGTDTSFFGQRHFEYYNNIALFNDESSDHTTFNMTWWMFVRGGTYVVHDNTMTALQSSDYGTKGDVVMTPMALQRDVGSSLPESYWTCWNQGGTPGALYPMPRQVGYGRVTGAGHDGKGNSTTPEVSGTAYVGDIEPAYLWNNNRPGSGVAPLSNMFVNDFGDTTAGQSCKLTRPANGNTDVGVNYLQANREWFNTASTPKPGYAPYTYPHPLTGAAPVTPAPVINISPSPVVFGNQLVGTTSSGLTVTITNVGNADDTLGTPFSTITGTNSADMARSGGTCTNGATLTQGGGNCTIILTFTPAAQGARSAQLNIAGTATQIASISGGGFIQIATPTFSPVAGTYPSTQNVTISTATGGAIICYTTDGSTPTANGSGTCTHGTTYSGPVVVSTSQTLKAMGTESGFFFDSAVATAAYVITPNTKFVTILGGLTINGGVTLGPP